MLACLSLVVPSVGGFGQAAHTTPSVGVCGHIFSIGMTRAVALSLIADSSECIATKIEGTDAESPSYLLNARSHTEVVHGQLSFAKDKLTLVSRNWDVDVHSDIEYGQILIGLLHQFEEEGRTSCTVSTSYRSTPELDNKDATITCGAKHLDLILTEYKGSKSIQISETLGY
jgi:hypothetical protein